MSRDIMSASEPLCSHKWRTVNVIMIAAKHRQAQNVRIMIDIMCVGKNKRQQAVARNSAGNRSGCAGNVRRENKRLRNGQ